MTDELQVRGVPALVLNDMFNRNLRSGDAAHDEKIRRSGIIESTVRCVELARSAGIPIVWIRVERVGAIEPEPPLVDKLPRGRTAPPPPLRPGSDEAANIDELPIADEDVIVLKPRVDPFLGSDLDMKLRARDVRTLFIGGYATNGGVEAAARTGMALGYDTVAVRECCYNVDEEAHHFALDRIFPAFSRVRTLDQVAMMLERSSTTPAVTAS